VRAINSVLFDAAHFKQDDRMNKFCSTIVLTGPAALFVCLPMNLGDPDHKTSP
jgi:hypothetical protein